MKKKWLRIAGVVITIVAIMVAVYLIEDIRSPRDFRCVLFEDEIDHFLNNSFLGAQPDYGEEFQRLEKAWADAINEYTANTDRNSLLDQNLYTEEQAKKLSFYAEKRKDFVSAFSQDHPLAQEFRPLIAQMDAAEELFASLYHRLFKEERFTIRELLELKETYVAAEAQLRSRFNEKMVPLLKTFRNDADTMQLKESVAVTELFVYIDHLAETYDFQNHMDEPIDDRIQLEIMSGFLAADSALRESSHYKVTFDLMKEYDRRWLDEDYSIRIEALEDVDIRSILCFSAMAQLRQDYAHWNGPVTMGQRNPAATVLQVVIAVALGVLVLFLILRVRKKNKLLPKPTPQQPQPGGPQSYRQPPAPPTGQYGPPPPGSSNRQ